MQLPHLIKATGLGVAVIALTAGAAMAAVASSSVNVRSGPSTSYRVIDQLQRGERVNVVTQSGSWCEVEKSGPDGWVACNYLVSSRDYNDDEYNDDGYDGYYYDDRPHVSIGLGIGAHRPHPPAPGFYRPDPGFSFGFGYSD